MDDLESLIAMAAEGGAVGAEGLDLLVARGAAAVPAVVAALDRGEGVPRWTSVLIALEDRDRVAALVEHLDHPNHTVTAALVRALGRSGEPAALAPLLAELDRGRHLLATITALGDLGAPEAVARLRAAARIGDPPSVERAAEVRVDALAEGDPVDAIVVAQCARSLAQLGDMSFAPIAIALASPLEDEDSYDDVAIRHAAVRALDALVAPGVAAALHAACADADREVADAALDATARLGRADDLARWVALAARRPDRIDGILHAIEVVTGDQPDPDDLDGWWAGARARFAPGRCYLGGAPASPGTLLPALREVDVGIVRHELRARTGVRFVLDLLGGDPATPRELARIERWWAEHAAELPPGALHRWGRRYDPGAVD